LHEYQIEYVKQFWEAYPENRKFFRTHFSEAHEILGELVLHIDDDIHDMLEYFYQKGYLDDTMIIVLSDHGAHSVTLRMPIFPDNSRYIENYLPLLIHLTPKDIPKESLGFLKSNQQSFISSHDVYSTLRTIAENKRIVSNSAESYPYIIEQIPLNHDCSNTTVYIGECWCHKDLSKLQAQIGEKSMFSFTF